MTIDECYKQFKHTAGELKIPFTLKFNDGEMLDITKDNFYLVRNVPCRGIWGDGTDEAQLVNTDITVLDAKMRAIDSVLTAFDKNVY